jgi:hypothetical protein
MLPMSNIAMIKVASFGLIALASVVVLGTNARDCGIFSQSGIVCPSSLGWLVACGLISCIFSVGIAAAYFFLPLDGILGTAEIGVLAFLLVWWAAGVGVARSTPNVRRTARDLCFIPLLIVIALVSPTSVSPGVHTSPGSNLFSS